MLDPGALAVTRRVTAVLDALDVVYVIGGSLAGIVHGLVRTTMDADIVADLRPEHAAALVAGLHTDFYIPDELTLRRAIEQHHSFNLIHLDTMFKVDMFLPGERAFDRQQLGRRKAQMPSQDAAGPLWILSPEDTILVKLDWFRQGGEVSERQWRDVVGVLKAQAAALDQPYLDHWAEALGVADLLARAVGEAGGA